jgi:hypothetical protein
MRHAVPILMAWAAVAQLGAAQARWLDVPVREPVIVANPALTGPCNVWRTLEQAARKARVRVGLEHLTLEAAQPSLVYPHTDLQLSSIGKGRDDASATGVIDRPIAVSFGRGSLLQALNAVTEPFGGIWQVGYSSGFMHVQPQTRDMQDGSILVPVRIDAPPPSVR